MQMGGLLKWVLKEQDAKAGSDSSGSFQRHMTMSCKDGTELLYSVIIALNLTHNHYHDLFLLRHIILRQSRSHFVFKIKQPVLFIAIASYKISLKNCYHTIKYYGTQFNTLSNVKCRSCGVYQSSGHVALYPITNSIFVQFWTGSCKYYTTIQ